MLTESALLEEREDGWLVRLEGWRVDRCCFDYQTRLLFFHPAQGKADVEGFEVILETPFELVQPDGTKRTLDPNGPRDALGPVLTLFQATVEEAIVERGGSLNIAFREGSRLRSEPNLDYEAWQLIGPNGLLAACLPRGGQPVVWQD